VTFALSNLDELVSFQVVLLNVVFLLVAVEHALRLRLLLALLLNQNLVALGNFNLVFFERQPDAHSPFRLLQKLPLGTPIVILVQVVAQGVFQGRHLLDTLLVLVLDALHELMAHGGL